MNHSIDWITIKTNLKNDLADDSLFDNARQLVLLLEENNVTPPNRAVIGGNRNYWFEWYFQNIDAYASIVIGDDIEYFFTDSENDAVVKILTIDEVLGILPKCMYTRYL